MHAGADEITACLLTDNAAGDADQLLELLETSEGEIASATADGTYDGDPMYQAIAAHQPVPTPDVAIPPCAPAVPSTENTEA